MNRIVTLDTETTGFSPVSDRIVEIGAVETIPHTGKVEATFHHIINPSRPIPKRTTRVHGIRDADVRDKPTFELVADDLIAAIRSATVVAHNGSFDAEMVDAELARASRPSLTDLDVTVVDSVKVAQSILPLRSSYNLDALCDAFGVDRAERAHGHGALLDAMLLAQLLPRLNEAYTAWQATEELLRAPALESLTKRFDSTIEPLTAMDSPQPAELPLRLGAATAAHRWAQVKERETKELFERLTTSPAWCCNHFFAKFSTTQTCSYKAAAEAVLTGHDLSDYEESTFVQRLSPKPDPETLAALVECDRQSWPQIKSSAHSLVGYLLYLRQIGRRLKSLRGELRSQFLELAQSGFTSDTVSVSTHSRQTIDYQRALNELAPGVDLGGFQSSHSRLVIGSRDVDLCALVFGGAPDSWVISPDTLAS